MNLNLQHLYKHDFLKKNIDSVQYSSPGNKVRSCHMFCSVNIPWTGLVYYTLDLLIIDLDNHLAPITFLYLLLA